MSKKYPIMIYDPNWYIKYRIKTNNVTYLEYYIFLGSVISEYHKRKVKNGIYSINSKTF